MSRFKDSWVEECGLEVKPFYSEQETCTLELLQLRKEGKEEKLFIVDKGVRIDIQFRTCLSCGKEFPSRSIGNRICAVCANLSNDDIEGTYA